MESSASLSLIWTSRGLHDGSDLRHCVGDVVSLPWTFTTEDGETVSSVRWYRKEDATRLEGVRLSVEMLPTTAVDSVTGDHHARLACGRFLSDGEPAVSAIWESPSGERLKSTEYSGGQFILNLPNPATGGRYTCHVHVPKSAKCVNNTGAMPDNGNVLVDGTELRFIVLEAENRQLKAELRGHRLETNTSQASLAQQLNSQLEDMGSDLTSRLAEVGSDLKARMAQEAQRLTEVDSRLTSELEKVDTRVKSNLTEMDSKLITQVDEIESKLKTELTERDTKLAALTEVDSKLTSELENVDTRLKSKLTEVDSKLITQVDEIESKLKTELTERDTKLAALTEVDSKLTSELENVDTRLKSKLTEMDSRHMSQLDEVETKLKTELTKRNAKLTAQLRGFDSKVTSRLQDAEKMKRQLNQLDSKLELHTSNAETKLTQNLKKHYESRIQQTEARLKQDHTELGRQVRGLDSRLASLTNGRVSTPYAFTALPRTNRQYNGNEVVIFDNIITNVGNMYSTWTGILTVPQDGVYMVSIRADTPAHWSSTLALFLDVVVNGRKMMVAYAERDVPSGVSGALKLKAGDRVWVRKSPEANQYSTVESGTLFSLVLVNRI
ncbi:hypothetical protein BaRGS_00013537 [Batillaria attramentaria]|uniref:C1q domain-containing protein n=1 Tax=Batillaria attramentaria TaxID=370345 RepID=A0ABD0L6Y2_9CAEN